MTIRLILEFVVIPVVLRSGARIGGGVYDLVVAKGWLTKEKLDELLNPGNMTHPGLSS